MTRYIKKALTDIRSNRFMNLITIVTISLSILVVSLFLLFFENAGRVIQSWNQGGRAMVYLEDSFQVEHMAGLKERIRALGGVESIVFISKDQAMDRLKQDMAGTDFLDTLNQNPLPHAFEIRLTSFDHYDKVKALTEKISALDLVESVEYGRQWLDRFLKVFHLFKLTGYAMCSLFLLIALFITANTVRMAFHSRELEVEIMRLVGATEGFIKTPFYVEGAVQGLIGGILGTGILFTAYLSISSAIEKNFETRLLMDIRFLSLETLGLLILASTFLGWFGCYLSLKQILK